MEPQIRYARTSDGVSIACYAVGVGRPVVWTQFPFSHLQAELRDPDYVRAYDAIAGVGTLVRYDARGFGLSDRDITSFTLDELVSDIEAVVDRLEAQSFVLLAGGASSPTALRYSAMHPERVSHLILVPGFLRPEGAGWKQWEALASSAVEDWDYVSEALPRAAFGWDNDESLRRDAELIRAAVTPQTLVRYLADAHEWDASDCVGNVRAPTLLLQQLDARYTTMDAARRLAAELPDGRIVMLTGATTAERQDESFAAVAGFIGGRASTEAAKRVQPSTASTESPTAPTSTGMPANTSIILFTDIADSTAITERIGDDGFRRLSRDLDQRVRAAMRSNGGTPVEGKVLGDGVMGVFMSAASAIAAARECVRLGRELPMHLGLHAGDVIREGTNVYGGAVNIASRICGLCEPGEILVSSTVRDLARTSAGVRFEDRGDRMLRGIEDTVRVFAVAL